MHLEDALGIAAGGIPPSDGHHAELARIAAELVNCHGPSSAARAELCPADRRIESFLSDYFADARLDSPLRLPAKALVLPRHGVARELSLPEDADSYANAYVRSYRLRNGVLHNPRADRRTTAGPSISPKGACRSPATRSRFRW